jgi:hypothetical protein
MEVVSQILKLGEGGLKFSGHPFPHFSNYDTIWFYFLQLYWNSPELSPILYFVWVNEKKKWRKAISQDIEIGKNFLVNIFVAGFFL